MLISLSTNHSYISISSSTLVSWHDRSSVLEVYLMSILPITIMYIRLLHIVYKSINTYDKDKSYIINIDPISSLSSFKPYLAASSSYWFKGIVIECHVIDIMSW